MAKRKFSERMYLDSLEGIHFEPMSDEERSRPVQQDEQLSDADDVYQDLLDEINGADNS